MAGTARWNAAGSGMLTCPMAAAAVDSFGNVYFASNWTMYSYAHDGTHRWAFTTGGNIYHWAYDALGSSPVVGAYDKVYFGAFDGFVFALVQTHTTTSATPLHHPACSRYTPARSPLALLTR